MSGFAGSNDAPRYSQALAAFEAGDREAAGDLCRQILARHDDADAVHLLGLIAYQRRDLRQAATLMTRALNLRADPAFSLNLGATWCELGSLTEAAGAFRAAIVGRPDMAEARLNLGQIAGALGRDDEAEAAFRAALALRPDWGTAHAAFGVHLQSRGHAAAAAAPLVRAVHLLADAVEPPSNLGVVRRALGRPDAARRAFHVAIARCPERDEPYTNLSGAERAAGRATHAGAALEKACRLNPTALTVWHERAMVAGALHRPATEAEAWLGVLVMCPDHTDALLRLAMLAYAKDDPGAARQWEDRAARTVPRTAPDYARVAADCISRKQLRLAVGLGRLSLALDPGQPDVLSNLSVAGREQGDETAVTMALMALRLAPDHTSALANLGATYSERDRQTDAVPLLRRAIMLAPQTADTAYGNLGAALLGLKKAPDAVAPLNRAIRLAPEKPDHRVNLASGLIDILQNAPDSMVADPVFAHLHRALALSPANPSALCDLGALLHETGRPVEAVRVLDRAVSLEPDNINAHWNLAFPRLLVGDLARGWIDYEWRLQRKEYIRVENPPNLPRWSGESFSGRSLLLFGEQGFGDMLQFARYAPILASAGARVHVHVPRPLVRLFSRLPGIVAVHPTDEPVPAVDLCCPMLSVPLRVGTTLETVPGTFPYLSADPADVAAWRERLGPADGRPRVGLVWAGNPNYASDRLRSIPAERIAPLLDRADIAWFSLQKNPRAADGEILGLGSDRLTDLSPYLNDFADTAGALSVLDLLISVDTSIIHLAGGLGRPVWGLMREPSDWRWLENREDSPWYPTLRLFRQSTPRDWTLPLARVADALEHLAASASKAPAP